MSRSSSVSAKDRTVQSKRSKPIKRRDDDSFDVRSQYTPVFPQPQIQVPTWAPNLQYAAMGDQQHFPGHIQNNFQTQLPSQYIQTAQQFPPAMINSGNMQVYPNVPQQVCSSPRTTGFHNDPSSNSPCKIIHDFSLMGVQFLHTVLRWPRQQCLRSGNHSNHPCTSRLTSHQLLFREGLRALFPMHSVNCQAQPIWPIQRASTRFLGASIGMHSTQRLSLLSPEILAFQFLNLCHITVLHCMAPHTMGLPASLTTPSRRLSRSTVTGWAITWQGRVPIIQCLHIMHLRICQIGQ